ncbi:MAG TPA: YgaP-like transmembrane domain [Bryobacteraceae bacterium]
MNETEQKIRLGIGCAAAASAIFAPLNYTWKGVLTAIAADGILTGIYRFCPVRRLLVH